MFQLLELANFFLRAPFMSTVQKATNLLFELSRHPEPQSLATLAQQLGSPKPSIHRLLQSLTHRLMVVQDTRGKYALGPGLVTLGLCATAGDPLIRASRESLARYSQQLGETFFLVTASAGELIVQYKHEGTGFLRASPHVGTQLPLHATAVGRLFLAFAPEQVSLDKNIRQFTKHTLIGPALASALHCDKQRGYAVSVDEWWDGLSAVAAPIIVFGRMLGAVAMACSSPRLTQLGKASAIEAVVAAAKRTSSPPTQFPITTKAQL